VRTVARPAVIAVWRLKQRRRRHANRNPANHVFENNEGGGERQAQSLRTFIKALAAMPAYRTVPHQRAR